MSGRFDPLAHPRNRLGRFVEVLRTLKPGQKVKLPGGISVEKRTRTFRIASPAARTPLGDAIPATERSAHDVEAVAKAVFQRSALTEHAKTIGGATRMTYPQFRKAELASRAHDPAWRNVGPEDIDDLLVRPTHGSIKDNWAKLDGEEEEARMVVDDPEANVDDRIAAEERLEHIERARDAITTFEDALPAPARSPGGDASREFGIARSEYRDAESAYLSATVFGEGDPVAAELAWRAAQDRLAKAEGRVGDAVERMGKAASKRLIGMKKSPGAKKPAR